MSDSPAASMTEAEIADLVKRLVARAAVGGMLQPELTEGERRVLRRAAVPRNFDRRLFEEVLAVPGTPSLDQLVVDERLQPIAGTKASYRVRRDLVADLQRTWWPDDRIPTSPTPPPPELAELLTALVEHDRAAGREVEAFEHLVLLDPPRAAKEFVRLYRKADRAFDLARCQDVIAAVGLESRPTLVAPELRELVQDRIRHLRVRGDHAADYYRTARFFMPPEFHEEVETFLKGEGRRVVQVVAEGGMGKTMRVRWLVARKCIPERIPIARIDLDDVDPVVVASDPWLVLLEIALQLHEQVPGAPFEGLAKEFGRYRPLLRRGDRKGPGGADLGSVRARGEIEVPERIRTILRETLGDGAMVIIVDTTEELVVPIERDATVLWRHLRVLHDACPGLRLIFAGRYDLAQRMPTFRAAFPGLRKRRVRRFKPEQSAEYLRMRGVKADDVIRAMVRASGGRPFKLALFGDIAQQDPTITAAAVRAYREPDLLFLVERVLDRIPDPGVHWLLRYGVIPRRLTLELASGPLAPLIARGMTGDPAFDDPRQDGLPESGRTRFATVDHPPDVAQLWRDLGNYAADASWVSMEDPTTLRFQPEVVEPMRRILRGREAWGLVNDAAATWFEQAAARDPDHWGEFVAEAAYHRFQSQGQAAVPWLQQRLAEAHAAGQPDWIRRLADEARQAAAGQGDRTAGTETAAEPGPRLVAASRVAADFELAGLEVADLTAKDVAREDPAWTKARTTLERVVRDDADRGIVPGVRLAELQATVALGLEDRQAAEVAIARGMALDPGEEDLATLLTLRALVAARDSGTADDAMRPALAAISSLARRGPGGWRSAAAAIDRLARAQIRQDRLLDAIEVHEVAATAAPDAAARAEHDLAIAELWTAAGLPGRALDRLERIGLAEADRGQWMHRQLVQAEAELVARRPTDTIHTAERVLEQLTKDVLAPGRPANVIELEGRAREARGEALAVVLRVDEALNDLDQARSVQSGEDSARALVLAVAVLLRVRGDLNQARQLLDGLQSAPPSVGGDPWVDGQLLRAEWCSRTGDPARATELIDETLGVLAGQHSGPARRIRAAVAALAFADREDRGRLLKVLIGALAEVERPELRWAYSARLDALGPGDGFWGEQFQRLGELLIEPQGLGNAIDEALAALRAAALDRLRDNDAALRIRALAPQLVQDHHGQMLLDAVADAIRWGEAELALELLHDLDGLGVEERGTPLQRASVIATLAAELVASDPVPNERRAEAERLLAEAITAVAGDRGTVVTAVVRAAEATVLTRLGDRQGAREAARVAREAYTALGDADSASLVGLPLPALGEEGPEDILQLQVRTSGGAVEVELRYSPADRPGEPTRTPRPSPSLALLDNPDAPPEQVYKLASEDLVSDAERYGDLLGSFLPTEGLKWMLGIRGKRVPNWPPSRLSLEVAERLLQPVPWELASIAGGGPMALDKGISALWRSQSSGSLASETVRFVQLALARLTGAALTADGVNGPQSRSAVEAFQDQASLESTGKVDDPTVEAIRRRLIAALQRPPRAVLLRTSASMQISSGTRGLETVYGVDLSRVYESLGFDVEVIESLDFATLQSVFGDRRYAMIHLAAATRVTSGGVVSLAFGDAGFDQPSGPEITAQLLGRLLLSGGGDPIVVLDVPRPLTPTEAARQLFLRNRFAADVFEQRAASTIVATGLMEVATNDSHSAMLEALVKGASVGMACSSARRVRAPEARAGLADATSAAAIALFARTPDVGLVAPTAP